jgi:hypothetical protein
MENQRLFEKLSPYVGLYVWLNVSEVVAGKQNRPRKLIRLTSPRIVLCNMPSIRRDKQRLSGK